METAQKLRRIRQLAASHRRHWLTIREAAEHLRVDERTVRKMIHDGRLTAYRNGPKMIRLDLNEIDARMERIGGAR